MLTKFIGAANTAITALVPNSFYFDSPTSIIVGTTFNALLHK